MLNQTLFETSQYEKISDVNRARVAYVSVVLFPLLFTGYAFAIPFNVPTDALFVTYFQRVLNGQPLFVGGFFAFYIVTVWTYLGVRRGAINNLAVALGPSIMIYLSAVWIGVLNNVVFAQNAFLLLPPVMIATLLAGERGFLMMVPITYLALIVGYVPFIGVEPANRPGNLILMLIVVTALISLMFTFLRTIETRRVESESETSRRRLQLAQLTTRITQSITEISDLDIALNQLVEEVRDSFPRAYHVQIFLVGSEGRIARLVASTGSVGRDLLARRHSLPVGSLSVIGQVTERTEPVIGEVGGTNSVHKPNDLLPNTRLEVAFPLVVGEQILGALDVQSLTAPRFTDEEMITLQAIANSIAVTINNNHLLREREQQLRENQRLVAQMQTAQSEVERLNRELTTSIWTDYLQKQDQKLNVDIDFEQNQIQSAAEFTEAIRTAIENGDITRRQENGHYVVAVPLRVRGEVIGAMEFEVDDELNVEDFDMLREVGERFGIAAETSRLYQTSQRVAQREALVNQISTRIQSGNSVQGTMAEAARSLRDALKAKRVVIHLGTGRSRQSSAPLMGE